MTVPALPLAIQYLFLLLTCLLGVCLFLELSAQRAAARQVQPPVTPTPPAPDAAHRARFVQRAEHLLGWTQSYAAAFYDQLMSEPPCDEWPTHRLPRYRMN